MSVLLGCAYTVVVVCTYVQYVHVCTSAPTFPIPATNFTLPIRLVDGNWTGEGRLEVKASAVYGTICDRGFSTRAANVACRQLGYYGASSVFDNSYFGSGMLQSWS